MKRIVIRYKWRLKLRCHTLARPAAPDRGRARRGRPAMMIGADDRQTLDSIEEGHPAGGTRPARLSPVCTRPSARVARQGPGAAYSWPVARR